MIPINYYKSMRQLTASVAVLLSLACVFSCKKEKGGGDALEKIYFVDPASATMVITQGRSEQILYATVPEKAADTAILEWFSDDPSIADVINGLVTAVAPGKNRNYGQMRQCHSLGRRAGGADSGHQFQRS